MEVTLPALPCRSVARRRGEVRAGERGSGQVPEGAEVELRYPENIGLANLGYFLLAPTLCYQISYPRRCGAGCAAGEATEEAGGAAVAASQLPVFLAFCRL